MKGNQRELLRHYESQRSRDKASANLAWIWSTFWTTLYGVLQVLISVELNHQQWLKKTWVSWVAQWWQHRHRFVFCDSQAVSSSQEDHLQHLQQSKPALQFSPTIRESHSPAQFRLIIWNHRNIFYSRAMGRRCNVHIWGKLTMIEMDQVSTTDIPNLHHTKTICSLCPFLVWFIFGANLGEITPRSLKFEHTAHMCGGPKQVWGDQKAGGPENLLALRAEGTKVSSWPSNEGEKTIPWAPKGRQNWICSGKLSQYTIYPLMSSVVYVELYALSGGTKLTQNLRAGDQTQF